MAFENHQQDAFDLRNDTERIKQFEAELNKATTSIGAAEIAAEKELAELKLKNLTTQQEARIKKLDELIEREEAGIRKLAALRLELSDKQFEARKKEIQKELQLLEEAIDKLHEAETKKAKKSEDPATKQTSNTEDITAASKSKSVVPAEKASVKDSKKTTDPDLIKLVGSIDKTLVSLRDTVVKQNQPKEKNAATDIKDVVADIKSDHKPQQTATAATKNIQTPSKNTLVEEVTSVAKEPQEAAKVFETEASRPKASEVPQPNLEAIEKAPIKEPEVKTQPELINLVSSIDKTLVSLLATVSGQSKEKGESANDGTRHSTTDDITDAMQQSQTDAQTENSDKPPVSGANKDRQPPKEEKQFANDASLLDPIDLGHYSFEAVFNAFDSLKDSLQADTGIVNALNQVTAKDKEGKSIESQTSIDLAGDLLVSVKKAEAAEEKHRELIADKDADEATKRAVALNNQILFETQLQKLREGHETKAHSLRLTAIANEAKANDIKNNREAYALEARLALQNELDERQTRNAEKSIGIEEQLAFIRENRDKLLAEEKKETDIKYAEKYAEHLLKAGEYAISLEEYKADQERKRQKAAKKETVGGMVDGIKKFGTGEFSLADIKQSYGEYMGQRTAELQESGLDENSAKLSAQFELLAEAAGSLAKMLDADVKKISAMQGLVDTRLQGSRANDRDFGNGSYWNELLEEIKLIAGVSPFVKQEKIVENVKTLIDKGISFDVKQRAFLMTIQEKIANTFNVADGTLLRLIRIQQQDTTAGRLGMESALNSFLNSMYETSEYLESVATNVRSSLEEMQALMEGAAATELEFQVQKWMGSLYSVGMSDSVVQDIAKTFGQIASGDVNGLTGSGTGNLLIMAANEAGMSIADILQEGLDADETNKLMQAMVNYLAEIAETSSDSKVVQQQLANVYGMKASDLRAATNLSSSIKDITKQDLTYSGMMGQLNHMMNTIRLRTSIGEGMTNMWDNMMYSMASTQASNPMLYLLPKMADLLRDVTGGGGIALPGISVMGNMVDLHTSVADLMSVASMAGTALGAIGPVLLGLSDLTNPLVGSAMLMRAGINPLGKAPVIARGSATPLQHIGGSSISESGYVGNASGEDVKNATLQDAEDSKKKQMVEAKDEESSDDVVIRSQQAIIDIYNLLEEVAHGSQSLRVRVIDNASGGGSGAAAGAPGGVDNGNWVLSI